MSVIEGNGRNQFRPKHITTEGQFKREFNELKTNGKYNLFSWTITEVIKFAKRHDDFRDRVIPQLERAYFGFKPEMRELKKQLDEQSSTSQKKPDDNSDGGVNFNA